MPAMSRRITNCLLLLSVFAWNSSQVQSDDPPAKAQSVSPAKSTEESSRAAAIYPGFAGYARTVTTRSEDTQRWFNQGIQLLYGYNHDEAIRSFEKAAEIDPSCAMAW